MQFFSFYISIPISTPSSHPFPTSSSPINSSERVRLLMGSQQSLTHHFEAGPSPLPILRLIKISLQKEWAPKSKFKHLGINPDPAASDPTDCPSHPIVTHTAVRGPSWVLCRFPRYHSMNSH